MFGLGIWEVVIILVVALLVLGPRRLPEAAQHLGKGLREFRRATRDLQSGFEDAMSDKSETAARADKPALYQPITDNQAHGETKAVESVAGPDGNSTAVPPSPPPNHDAAGKPS